MTVMAWDGNMPVFEKRVNRDQISYSAINWATELCRQWADPIIDAGLILADWYLNGGVCEKFPFSVRDSVLVNRKQVVFRLIPP